MQKKLLALLLILFSLTEIIGCDGNSLEKILSNKLVINSEHSEPQLKKIPVTKQTPNYSQKSTGLTSDTLKDFESCNFSENFLSIRENIIKNSKPLQAFDGFLSYKVNTSFHGLPVKEIIFGVCITKEPLVNNCSFAKDIAIILDSSFIVAKNQLLERKDIDYSKEKRANLNKIKDGPTLQPTLYEGADGSTVLHCDTGGL